LTGIQGGIRRAAETDLQGQGDDGRKEVTTGVEGNQEQAAKSLLV